MTCCSVIFNIMHQAISSHGMLFDMKAEDLLKENGEMESTQSTRLGIWQVPAESIYIYIYFFKYTYLFMTREEVHDVSWGVGWLIWQSTVVGYPQPFIQQCLQMHWDRKWFGVSLGLGCTFLSCCSCTTNVACWCFLGISTWHCRKAGRQPDTNRAADLLLRHHFQAAICSLSFA